MPEDYDNIRCGIVELLKAARSAAAQNVNSIMTARQVLAAKTRTNNAMRILLSD
jgi:hypothetical protein